MARKSEGNKKKKTTAKKKPTPKAGTNVGSQMTQAQKDAFKKKRNIDIRSSAGSGLRGKGAPKPKTTTKPRRR